MYHIATTSFHSLSCTCSLSDIFRVPSLLVFEHLKKMKCRDVILFLGGPNCAGRSLNGDEFGLPVRRTGMEEHWSNAF